MWLALGLLAVVLLLRLMLGLLRRWWPVLALVLLFVLVVSGEAGRLLNSL